MGYNIDNPSINSTNRFIKETEKSRQTINKFIEEQTNDKIKNLIPKGILTPITRLVLTNAIYFKGTWEWEFDKSDTSERDFKISENNVVKTEMMYMKCQPRGLLIDPSELIDIVINWPRCAHQ